MDRTSTTVRVDTANHTGLPDDLTANLRPSIDDAVRVQLTRFTYPYSDIYVVTRVVHDTTDAFYTAVEAMREKVNRRDPDTRTYAMLRAAIPDAKFPGVLDVHHIITTRTSADRTRETFFANTATFTGSWEDGSVATIYTDGGAIVTDNTATALEVNDAATPAVTTMTLTNHTTAYIPGTTYLMITDSGDGSTTNATVPTFTVTASLRAYETVFICTAKTNSAPQVPHEGLEYSHPNAFTGTLMFGTFGEDGNGSWTTENAAGVNVATGTTIAPKYLYRFPQNLAIRRLEAAGGTIHRIHAPMRTRFTKMLPNRLYGPGVYQLHNYTASLDVMPVDLTATTVSASQTLLVRGVASVAITAGGTGYNSATITVNTFTNGTNRELVWPTGYYEAPQFEAIITNGVVTGARVMKTGIMLENDTLTLTVLGDGSGATAAVARYTGKNEGVLVNLGGIFFNGTRTPMSVTPRTGILSKVTSLPIDYAQTPEEAYDDSAFFVAPTQDSEYKSTVEVDFITSSMMVWHDFPQPQSIRELKIRLDNGDAYNGRLPYFFPMRQALSRAGVNEYGTSGSLAYPHHHDYKSVIMEFVIHQTKRHPTHPPLPSTRSSRTSQADRGGVRDQWSEHYMQTIPEEHAISGVEPQPVGPTGREGPGDRDTVHIGPTSAMAIQRQRIARQWGRGRY